MEDQDASLVELQVEDIPNVGTLQVVWGPMFAGKTTELLRRLLVASVVERGRVLYVNHTLDKTRTGDGPYSTHNPILNTSTTSLHMIMASSVRDILRDASLMAQFTTIGIDEAQFFGDSLVKDVLELVERHGKCVIVAGLALDYKRRKFGRIGDLCTLTEDVVKLEGKCMRCAEDGKHSPSLFTHRLRSSKMPLGTSTGQTLVGGNDTYIAVCRSCFICLNPDM